MISDDEDLDRMSADDLRNLKQRVLTLMEDAAKQTGSLEQKIEGAIEIDAFYDFLKKIEVKLLEKGET
jgi:hypothetical protein